MDGPCFDVLNAVVVLFDDLDDPVGAGIDQNRAAVHDRVAIIPGAVFRRHVVIGDALFRQNCANPDVLTILIGRATLLDDITVKAWALVHAKNPVHAAHHPADHAADDRANWTRCSFAFPRTSLDPAGDPLRLCCYRQRHASGKGSNSDETADHDISNGGDEVIRQVMKAD